MVKFVIFICATFLLYLFPVNLTGQTTINLFVTIEPDLVVTAGENQTIEKGRHVIIGGSPAAQLGYRPYTFLWVPSSGLSDPTIANPVATPDTTTTYTLTVTDGKHCTETARTTITVNSPSDTTSEIKLDIFPNPVLDFLYFRITGMEGTVRIRLVNLLGSMVTENVYVDLPIISDKIYLKNLSTGIYLLQVLSIAVNTTRMVIKI